MNVNQPCKIKHFLAVIADIDSAVELANWFNDGDNSKLDLLSKELGFESIRDLIDYGYKVDLDYGVDED